MWPYASVMWDEGQSKVKVKVKAYKTVNNNNYKSSSVIHDTSKV